jgi:acetoin utilization deacetylase AcuC-like enzyme
MFAFESGLFPAMEKFKPDMIFISAGFDSRIGDPLGNLTLTDDDYYDLTGLMVNLAQRYAQSRLVSVLEGGYNLSGLASAVTTHVRRLTEA